MSVNDHELSIHYHWERTKRSYNVSDSNELPSNLLREAEYAHIDAVIDALAALHMLTVSLSGGQTNEEAAAQLGRGFGRRTKFIWLSVRELLNEVPPDHNKPLSIEVAERASRTLNQIYIDIRGSLDNLARCLLAILPEGTSSKPLAPIQIELFNSKFLERIGNTELCAFVEQHKNWNNELKDRRDPAAHRLPLFVLQAYQNDETVNRHEVAKEAYLKANSIVLSALSRGEYNEELIAKAEKLRDDLLGIGKFHPLFTYDDTLGFMQIYPTVPEDIGKLILIGREVLRHIARQIK